MGGGIILKSLSAFMLIVFAGSSPVENGDGKEALCPEGIKSFSAAYRSREYYRCTKRNGKSVAEKVLCPVNHVYVAVTKMCQLVEKNKNTAQYAAFTNGGGAAKSDKAEQIDNQDVMGRNVLLGALYDGRKDRIHSSRSLWSKATIDRNRTVDPRTYEFQKIFVGSTEFDRMAKMDIKAELALSFLSGLIEVSGSARYLRESSETSKTLTANLVYYATTHIDGLPSRTKKDYTDLCGDSSWTHVVSEITYGISINFKFHRIYDSITTKQEVGGSLGVKIDSIPGIGIEGKASVDISGNDRKELEKFTVESFANTIIQDKPTTFEEARKFVTTASAQINDGDTGMKPQPLKMSLTPKSVYCKTEDSILNAISNDILGSVSRMLNDLENNELDLRVVRQSKPCQKYLSMQEPYNKLDQKMNTFISKFKDKLKQVLPEVRSGLKGELALSALMIEMTKSIYERVHFRNFITHRLRTVNILTSIMEKVEEKSKNLLMSDYKSGNDVTVLLNNDKVVVLELFIIEAGTNTDRFLTDHDYKEESDWTQNSKMLNEVTGRIYEFTEFALANKDKTKIIYQLSLKRATKNKTVNCWSYDRTISETKDFVIPTAPLSVEIPKNEIRSTGFKIIVKGRENKLIDHLEVVTERVLGGERSVTQFDINKNDNTYLMTNLEPGTQYRVSVQYRSKFGVSPARKNSGLIETRACAPPVIPNIEYLKHNFLHLSWNQPMVATGFHIKHYNVEYSVDGGKPINYRAVTTDFQLTAGSGSSTVNIKMTTVARMDKVTDKNMTKEEIERMQKDFRSQTFQFTVATLPKPVTPLTQRVTDQSAIVTWLRPLRLAKGVVLESYTVCYYQRDTKDRMVGKPNCRQKATTETKVQLDGLVQGTKYATIVQINLLVDGQRRMVKSQWQGFQTLFKQTELEKLHGVMTKDMKHMASEVYNEVKSNVTTLQSKLKEMYTILARADEKNMLETNKKFSEVKSMISTNKNELQQTSTKIKNEIKTMVPFYGNIKTPTNSRVRFDNKPYGFYGILYYRWLTTYWYPVCDDAFEDNDATVACVEAGYPKGFLIYKTGQNTGTDVFSMDNLGCGGGENRLGECPHTGYGDENCKAHEGVFLVCIPN